MIDIEADFWKEIFVHLLHKNMVRTNAEPLNVSNSEEAFNRFSLANPQYTPEITRSESYVTWELFVTPTIKFRLFIQNQIKASLMQKSGNELVKICDAKFPYNPFPEISEFLANKNNYLVELEHKKEDFAKTQRKLAIASEFIKANLSKKYDEKSNVIWNLELQEKDIKLTLEKDGRKDTQFLTPENFMGILKKIE